MISSHLLFASFSSFLFLPPSFDLSAGSRPLTLCSWYTFTQDQLHVQVIGKQDLSNLVASNVDIAEQLRVLIRLYELDVLE